MRTILSHTRDTILSTPDRVSLERAELVTEAYRMYAGEPAPLLRAKAFGHVLQHMTLDLATNPIFAGNTSPGPRQWMLLPEYGFTIPAQALIENTRLEGLLDGDAIPAEMRAFWQGRSFGGSAGWGHLAVDQRRVLAEGLNAILAEVDSCLTRDNTPENTYRRAMQISLRAVIGWAARYSRAAALAAEVEPDPTRAQALRRVADACRRVPAQPARSLFEALQALTLVHLAIHIEGHGYSVSPGRLDQLLLPYYHDDEDAVDLIAAFLLKLTENSVFGSHSKTQPITLGGAGLDGRDQSNPLTLMTLEAVELARVPDPIVFLRWHTGLDVQVKHKAVAMLARGFSMPMLVGDVETIAGLVQGGVRAEDAADYCIVGCNELGIPGQMIYDNTGFPEIFLLREVVITAPAGEIESMDDLLAALQARAEHSALHSVTSKLAAIRRSVEVVPTPFTSALMAGCIAAGCDFYGATRYPHVSLLSMGFANLVNSLAALDEVVFRKRQAGLAEVAAALEANFKGHERLRQRLVHAPKWGAQEERADRWAQAWMERREQVRMSVERQTAAPLLMELVVRSLHHLHGRGLGATPDGRLAGEPLADSVGAPDGVSPGGPTALLGSVCRLTPARYWTGGYNFNLTLPVMDWNQPEMHARLEGMIDVFFSGGGQELQINALDPAVLAEAQVHPERHPDLMVRIAGFNARFIDLSVLEQDEILHRAQRAGEGPTTKHTKYTKKDL